MSKDLYFSLALEDNHVFLRVQFASYFSRRNKVYQPKKKEKLELQEQN